MRGCEGPVRGIAAVLQTYGHSQMLSPVCPKEQVESDVGMSGCQVPVTFLGTPGFVRLLCEREHISQRLVYRTIRHGLAPKSTSFVSLVGTVEKRYPIDARTKFLHMDLSKHSEIWKNFQVTFRPLAVVQLVAFPVPVLACAGERFVACGFFPRRPSDLHRCIPLCT